MPWVRIDDRFAQHPKVVAAGPLAMAMQVAALGYCNRELTDGFIPRAIARTLLDFQVEREDGRVWTMARTCGMQGDDVDAGWVITCLVGAGMWEEVPGGYEIHDYHDYQPSREQVLKEREQTRKRVESWRERNAVTNTVTNGSVTDAPVPVPVPVPVPRKDVSKPTVSHPPDRGGYSQAFESFWTSYGPTNGPKKPAYTAWKNLTERQRVAAVEALPRWLASDKWCRGFKDYPQKYLNQRFWEADPEARREPNGQRPPGLSDEEAAAMVARVRALGAREEDVVETTR